MLCLLHCSICSSLLTGMRLNSKDAVLTWYHCREVRLLLRPPRNTYLTALKVTRRFNSKINVRLASIMLFVFLIPVISFSALGVCRQPPHKQPLTLFAQFGMFDPKSAAAAFITPKFFAQTLFYSVVFVLAVCCMLSTTSLACFLDPLSFFQIVLQVVFSSKQNKQQDIENLMIARLVA